MYLLFIWPGSFFPMAFSELPACVLGRNVSYTSSLLSAVHTLSDVRGSPEKVQRWRGCVCVWHTSLFEKPGNF